jgi:hypothetical protein
VRFAAAFNALGVKNVCDDDVGKTRQSLLKMLRDPMKHLVTAIRRPLVRRKFIFGRACPQRVKMLYRAVKAREERGHPLRALVINLWRKSLIPIQNRLKTRGTTMTTITDFRRASPAEQNLFERMIHLCAQRRREKSAERQRQLDRAIEAVQLQFVDREPTDALH